MAVETDNNKIETSENDVELHIHDEEHDVEGVDEVNPEHDENSDEYDEDEYENDEETTDEIAPVLIEEGDIFVYQNNVIALNILSISKNVIGEKTMRVRLMSLVNEPVETTEKDVRQYIANDGLLRLTTERDHMREISKKLFFSVGDTFTVNGEFLYEIISDELPYIDQSGNMMYVIGYRDSNDVVAFKDALEVKGLIYGMTDQFPSQGE